MVCEENLVPHKLRQHPNLNCKDVQWHPQQATQLATGSSSGTVLLWNLEGRVNDKLSRTLTGHSRAVNRVCYVPQEASRLLSGSQDCTVKQWDTRVRFAQQHSYRTAAEVRDVAVSRLSPELRGGARERHGTAIRHAPQQGAAAGAPSTRRARLLPRLPPRAARRAGDRIARPAAQGEGPRPAPG